jgi:hypothetical protein
MHALALTCLCYMHSSMHYMHLYTCSPASGALCARVPVLTLLALHFLMPQLECVRACFEAASMYVLMAA